VGYKKNISYFLANLCCFNNELPQGAPTSPYISNIRMKSLDKEIGDYCNNNSLRFTRYADDFSISGDANIDRVISFVSNKVYANGFSLNSSKTRIARQNARQEVTGIIVNNHMQVQKRIRKDIRQEVYYIRKFGLESHLSHIHETRKNYLRHLLGKTNFAFFVNPKDVELLDYYRYLKELLRNENVIDN